MLKEMKMRLANLLAEAEEAADPRTSGLMDRTDFQRIVSELAAAMCEVMTAVEQSELAKIDVASGLLELRPVETYEFPALGE